MIVMIKYFFYMAATLLGMIAQPGMAGGILQSAGAGGPCLETFSHRNLTPIQNRQYLSRVLNECPEKEETILYLSNALIQNGEHTTVKDVLKKLSMSSQNPSFQVEAYAGLANIASTEGNKNEALQAFENAQEVVKKARKTASRQMLQNMESFMDTLTTKMKTVLNKDVREQSATKTFSTIDLGNGNDVNNSRLKSNGKVNTLKSNDNADVSSGGIKLQ